jgi:WD40 repeat protein
MNDLVRQSLREIVVNHGRALFGDARLCESLLKDYCGQYKKEIFVLVCAVREQVATDLLVSQDGMPRELLRMLLVKRLQQNLSLTEEASRWAVESWAWALDRLPGAEMSARSLAHAQPKVESGILGSCERAVRAIAAAPDGTCVASGSDDGKIRLWNIYTGQMEVLGECDGAVSAVDFSPDGNSVTAASEQRAPGSAHRIGLWDIQSGQMRELGECGGRAPAVLFSPDGKRVAASSAEVENSLRVWNLQTGELKVFASDAGGIAAISFAPDGQSIAACDARLTNPMIRLWDLDAGRARVLGNCSRQLTSLAFSPDGESLASGGRDETIRLWDVRTGQTRALGKNCSYICGLAFSPNGEQVAACSLDSKIRICDVERVQQRIVGECPGVNSIAFSADGTSLVTGSFNGSIRVWNAQPR